MQAKYTIPGLADYPDLRLRFLQDMNALNLQGLTKCRNGCAGERQALVQKYGQLVQQADAAKKKIATAIAPSRRDGRQP